jgi:predicted nucleic-acid-binding protein
MPSFNFDVVAQPPDSRYLTRLANELDSNILVRYLTQDDPIQSPKATEIIEQRLLEENPGFVSIVAIVETVWSLDRASSLGTHEIAAAVERMLQAAVLRTRRRFSPP